MCKPNSSVTLYNNMHAQQEGKGKDQNLMEENGDHLS